MADPLAIPSQTPTAQPRRVFLTGAAGRLGSLVRKVLRAAGHHLLPTDLRDPDADPDFHPMNLLDGPAVHAAIQSHASDTIVHLGNHSWPGARPPLQLFNENILMTMNVFDAARSLGIRRILYASTVQVIASEFVPGYTARPPRLAYLPLDGDSPADPTNTYALSKHVGELILAQWATEMDLAAVSLRFPMLINFDLPKIKAWRESRAHKEPSPTVIAQGFSWLSYLDAADLLAALLATPWTGHRTYYPAAPGPRCFESVSDLLQKHYLAIPRKPGHQGPLQSLVDISKITQQTAWSPRHQLF